MADLYAGAGLFSVPLADAVGPSGSVLAVERDRRACADARHNGADFRHLRRPGGRRDAPARGDRPGSARHRGPRTLPARGAGTDVMRALAPHAWTVRTVIYVPCDPVPFGARHPRKLLDEGGASPCLRLRHLPYDRTR